MTRNELMTIIAAHFERGMRLTEADNDRELRNDTIEDMVAEAQELLAENDTPVYTEIPRTMPRHGKVSTEDYYINVIWKIEQLGYLADALASSWSNHWGAFCELVCYNNLLFCDVDKFEECELVGDTNCNQRYYYSDGMGVEVNSCGEFVDWMNFDVHTITDERGNEKQVIYIQREVNSIGEVVMTYIEVPDDCNELYAHKA